MFCRMKNMRDPGEKQGFRIVKLRYKERPGVGEITKGRRAVRCDRRRVCIIARERRQEGILSEYITETRKSYFLFLCSILYGGFPF